MTSSLNIHSNLTLKQQIIKRSIKCGNWSGASKKGGLELLNINSNLQLVIAQMKGEYEVKEPLLAKYI